MQRSKKKRHRIIWMPRGTEKEADAAAAYVKELEADIMPIDGLISLQVLTWVLRYLAQMAQKILAHAEEIKACRCKIL